MSELLNDKTPTVLDEYDSTRCNRQSDIDTNEAWWKVGTTTSPTWNETIPLPLLPDTASTSDENEIYDQDLFDAVLNAEIVIPGVVEE